MLVVLPGLTEKMLSTEKMLISSALLKDRRELNCERAHLQHSQTPGARVLTQGALGSPYSALWAAPAASTLPQFPDDLRIGKVLIHHGMVHDPLGPICVSQRGEGLFRSLPAAGLMVAIMEVWLLPPDCPATYFKQHLWETGPVPGMCGGKQQMRAHDLLRREPDVETGLFHKNFVTRGTVISLYSHQSTMPVEQHYNGKMATGMSLRPACLGIW